MLKLWPRGISHSYTLIFFTLATGGLFKLSAFLRESFIASRFGLSAITDAYFSLQQLPLAVATYMFGAFLIAFAPAFAAARQRSTTVGWLPGLVLYASAAGIMLTVVMLGCAPWLLRIFTHSNGPELRSTLAIMSLCFAPILYIGIWSGMCTARGSNIKAMTVTGLPYLVMTLALLAIYLAGKLGALSLAISLTAGFLAVGVFSLVCILRSQRAGWLSKVNIRPWQVPGFAVFIRQLAVSSMENIGFAGNQLLIIYFLAQAGTGAVSANNCAMRIGMLGYTIISAPLTQLAQARLCVARLEDRPRVFRKWLLMIGASVAIGAIVLFSLRFQIIAIVYLRGKFTLAESVEVAALLPAWIAYFIVLSVNSLAARNLFMNTRGAGYAKLMISAYIAANIMRLAIMGHATAAQLLWCSVVAEGCALVVNLVRCFRPEPVRIEPVDDIAPFGAVVAMEPSE